MVCRRPGHEDCAHYGTCGDTSDGELERSRREYERQTRACPVISLPSSLGVTPIGKVDLIYNDESHCRNASEPDLQRRIVEKMVAVCDAYARGSILMKI